MHIAFEKPRDRNQISLLNSFVKPIRSVMATRDCEIILVEIGLRKRNIDPKKITNQLARYFIDEDKRRGRKNREININITAAQDKENKMIIKI